MARWARNASMAPNWLHNQQAVSGWDGWNCHGRCAVSTCTLTHHMPANCPLPLHRDEVSCCEITGDMCGLMSATISHTSSSEADGGAGARGSGGQGERGPALLVLVCVYFAHHLPNTTGGPSIRIPDILHNGCCDRTNNSIYDINPVLQFTVARRPIPSVAKCSSHRDILSVR